jgi:eukaryotic-like serine/threonine-protein kinase
MSESHAVSSSVDISQLSSLNELLKAALALPEHERASWFAQLSPEQRDLHPSLGALLARAEVGTDSFMQQSVGIQGTDADLDSLDTLADQSGDHIGPYRLIEPLGKGGMATVWLAGRHDGSLHRQVALKLPHEGWALGLARRMARERDILASLEHPGIARLYDAGVTATGRPWLAMERVSGLPIDQFCRAHGLGVRQRLQLFLQVIDAVAHAHARLVVHRDLKPSNIMVSDAGKVLLLDFGVAKLLSVESIEGQQLTNKLERAITPAYAAPEQASGGVVSVATDVYSLGVVLYELLTGSLPYRLEQRTASTLEHAILRAEVTAPSQRVRDDVRLAAQLRGDLDLIACKALNKTPADRYPSVESLAADLQRHLESRPILAQAPSRHYLMRKFINRNRFAIGVGTAAASSLLLGLGIALWQAQEARKQQKLAYERLAHSEASLAFSNEVMTEGLNANEALTLDDLLQRGSRLAASEVGKGPMERAVATDAVTGWLMALGRLAPAETLFKDTLESLPATFSPSMKNMLRCKRGANLAGLGRVDEGVALIMLGVAASDSDDATASFCLQRRALVARNQGDAKASLAHLQQALLRFDASSRDQPSSRALLLSELALSLSANGLPREANRYYAEAVQVFEAAGLSRGGAALTTHNNWGLTRLNAGNPRAALAHFDYVYSLSKPQGNDGHAVIFNRAQALRALGRYDEAAAAYKAYGEKARIEGDAADELRSLVGLASLALRVGAPAESARLLSEGRLLIEAGRVAKSNGAVIGFKLAQAQIWQRQGELAHARELCTELLSSFEQSGLKVATVVAVRLLRADLAAADGQSLTALNDAQVALALAQTLQAGEPHSYVTGQAFLQLAKLHHADNRRPQALDAMQKAADNLSTTLDTGHPLLMELASLQSQLRGTSPGRR